MSQSFKHALRALAHRPGFTFLLVLITAICIGGNAAVFSAAKAVLFQDLSYEDDDRLVHLILNYDSSGDDTGLAYAELADLRQRIDKLEDISLFNPDPSVVVEVNEAAERVGILLVTPSHFQALGVKPHLGRLFTEEEENAPEGGAPVVVISYELWQRLFGGDPGLVGESVQMGPNRYTVVGILPEGYFGVTEAHSDVDAWFPAVMATHFYPTSEGLLENRAMRFWQGLAKVKEGVSFSKAAEEVATVGAQLAADYPDSNEGYSLRIAPLRRFMFGDIHRSMRVLIIGGFLILLVGCANIAGLLLVRVVDRRGELAMRLALGAGRSHLMMQMLFESLLLALAGGLLGTALAAWGIRVLSKWMQLPEVVPMGLDGAVLGVIIGASVLTGLLFGLPPALGASRMELNEGLVQRSRTSGGGDLQGARARNALVVFQVAVVTVLLLVAGLLLRSFWELRNEDVDFDTANLLTLRLPFTTENYEDRQNISLVEKELLGRVEAVPGVESAIFWGPGVPGIYSYIMMVQPEGASEEETPLRTSVHSVSPGGIHMMRVPLLQGREFNRDDTDETQRVAVITRSIAEAFWPGEEPIGKRIQRFGRPDYPLMEVVGLIPDAMLSTRFTDGYDQLIMPHQQWPTTGTTLVVRTTGSPTGVVDQVREAVRQVAPDVPPYDIATLDAQMREGERAHRLNAAIVGLYAGLALLFALLGLYGTLAYSVLQRTQEIGVRVAFGAPRGSILRMVMKQGLGLVALGVVIGLAASFAITGVLDHMLYGVTEHDPLTFLAVVLSLSLVALFATFLPARRALRIEPTEALRFE